MKPGVVAEGAGGIDAVATECVVVELTDHGIATGAFTKDVDVAGVTAKVFDFVLDPMQGHALVPEAEVGLDAVDVWREEAEKA